MPKKPVARNRRKSAHLRAGLKAKLNKQRMRKAGMLRKRKPNGRLQR
jgi:hypothetical protein